MKTMNASPASNFASRPSTSPPCLMVGAIVECSDAHGTPELRFQTP
jgi:hypothetical protein